MKYHVRNLITKGYISAIGMIIDFIRNCLIRKFVEYWMCQAEVAIRKYTIYGGRQFRKEIGMTKETLDDIREVIGTLSVCMSYKSINNITSIPTYDLLHQVNILKKIVQKNINYVVDGSRCVVVEESNSEKFKNCVDNYLDKGYKISASSCNSKTWKAILVREGKEQEDK
jgi:hypothetical protein